MGALNPFANNEKQAQQAAQNAANQQAVAQAQAQNAANLAAQQAALAAQNQAAQQYAATYNVGSVAAKTAPAPKPQAPNPSALAASFFGGGSSLGQYLGTGSGSGLRGIYLGR